MPSSLAFFTFGMFIIDEIEYTGNKKRIGIIGGAGTYAAIGARLVAGQKNAHLVGFIVDKGRDFPVEFTNIIDSWQTNVVYREDSGRLTTRAWNGYEPGEHRDFKYLTPKIRIDEKSLSNAQIMARNFHMVCSPDRCLSLVAGIKSRRRSLEAVAQDFSVVWEPVPELCVPEQLAAMRETARQVDIVSPNAEEFSAFFAVSQVPLSQAQIAGMMVEGGIGPKGEGALVIREGSNGCSVYTRLWSAHIPAYFRHESSSRVIDPTGGGNAFLGALTMSLGQEVHPATYLVEKDMSTLLEPLKSHGRDAVKILVAVIYATVAASFVIEQQGMPGLTKTKDRENEWNGELFEARLSTFIKREEGHIRLHLQIG